ncbi:hypothetical protein Cgig2_031283 [Carnegiea gigantea]|uniref:Ribosomal protein L34Ae n=1 Tax=Carnegiea gigantea TaxID=171969 RepID=A0A9Q1QMF4_9CARY|nr:hypothetical protein Cgig2_031283 [Carnegiea gigantea]
MTFTVQEMFVISNDGSANRQGFLDDHTTPKNNSLGNPVDFFDLQLGDDVVVDPNPLESVDICELSRKEESVTEAKTESSICGLSFEEEEALSFTQLYFCEQGKRVNVEHRGPCEHEFSDEVVSSVPSSDDFWAVIHKFDDYSGDSGSDETKCDTSPAEALQSETSVGIGGTIWDSHEHILRSSDDYLFDEKSLHLVHVNEVTEHKGAYSQFLYPDLRQYNSTFDENATMDKFSDSAHEPDLGNSCLDDSNEVYPKDVCDREGDQTGFDVLSEQKELIRQMKKEMRRLKSGGGLPTILEESESPRVEDDLRPLKIDDRIGHKDQMVEIQTIYKGYLDKMRKLDILSQQAMYAIGLLRLKSQDHFTCNKRISIPIIKSLLAQNFWSYKLRKHEADPVQKMIKDFQMDLELVYVGQLCLSWEILKWQHHKAGELQAYDPDGFHQHNHAAAEFQKFQVLLQRFTEDEPFHHGPRVQHYVKNRCDLPNLLQVPVIKDDPSSEWRRKGEGPISIGMLKELIRASMTAFWEFLRADKSEMHAQTQMGIPSIQFNLQDPLDAELLMEIRSNLQKKEKKLKDLGRSGNCIVKKFQKHQDLRLSDDMLLAQVELRLITRVLQMPRLTTNQLLWSHKKLSKINIVGRKVYFDSSFLLFPC